MGRAYEYCGYCKETLVCTDHTNSDLVGKRFRGKPICVACAEEIKEEVEGW